jgi:peptidoglycan-associated lipoprotein
MKISRSSPVSVFALVLCLALVATSCQTTARKPRDHWWQFWRPAKPVTASIYPEEQILPPPPGLVELQPRGEVQTLPLETPAPPSEEMTPSEPTPLRVEPRGIVSELKTVYFEFDSAALTPDARGTLEGDAQWLLQHPGIQIQIEGHCDERGTIEYNYNLGERRANSVKEFLITRGVDPGTIHTISYGEERPVDPGHDESAWAKNRRAQFLIY